MLILKALHIIAMVAWFAGLFYLPRLFVYHADVVDEISLHRFMLMERRLFYGIMWPAAVMTTVFGLGIITYNFDYYMHAGWMHIKMLLVLMIWGYHLICGHFVKQFARGKNMHSSRYYRLFNEVPTIILIAIVFAVVLKP